MINWDEIQYFKPEEFPEGVLYYLMPEMVYILDNIRDISDVPIYPSPVYEAHVRHDCADSFHCVSEDGFSTATDFFVKWEDAMTVYHTLIDIPDVGGVGIYDDKVYNGEPHCMFHIDDRPDALMWVYKDGEYTYNTNAFAYYSKLLEIIKKRNL